MIQSSPVWSNATRLTLCLHSTIGQKRFCSAQIFSASYLNGGTTSRCLTAMIPKVWGRLPVQGRNYFRGCTATHIKFFSNNRRDVVYVDSCHSSYPCPPVSSISVCPLILLLHCSSDVDECVTGVCAEECLNTPGSFRCFCDGRQGLKLSQDLRSCEVRYRFIMNMFIFNICS